MFAMRAEFIQDFLNAGKIGCEGFHSPLEVCTSEDGHLGKAGRQHLPEAPKPPAKIRSGPIRLNG